MKREFLRGYIIARPAGLDYTVESLSSVYKKYRKQNPEVRKDIDEVV